MSGRRLRVAFRRASPVLAAALVVATTLAAERTFPDPFARLQGAAFDSLQRVVDRRDPVPLGEDGVVVVDLDDASLKAVGQWPWSRHTVAALVGALQDAGARAIGLDIVFAEPDRTSPRRLAAEWAGDHGLVVRPARTAPGETAEGAPEAALPDYDDDLARVIARGRVVMGFGLTQTAEDGKRPRSGGLIRQDAADLRGFRAYQGAVRNLPALERAAADQGSIMAAGEADEVVRRVPLVMLFKGSPVPSLALSTLRVAEGATAPAILKGVPVPWLGPAGKSYLLRVGAHTVPLDADGAMRLRAPARDATGMIGGRVGRPALSALQVLAASRDAASAARIRESVAGRIVFVGTSAIGLVDLRPTPFNPSEPGVNIHAEAVAQILRGNVLVRPPWAPIAETGTAAALALALALLVGTVRLRLALAAAGAAAAGTLAAAWAAYGFGWLLDVSLPLLLPPLAFASAALTRHYFAERDARTLRAAFKQYLSPDLVETLARDPDGLKLGGEEREMTFLFTDLEGFTSFTERVAPAVLVSTLNAYLDGICAIAFRHGGTIDKIVGDAVHVMFNAPLTQPDHAARAVACALDIDAFARAFAARGGFGVTRVGVNTGTAVVGNFGGTWRFDYTAHGDAINTAARLEAVNKRFGTTICVSRATVERAGPGAARFRAIGAVLLKGKASPTEIYMAAPASGGTGLAYLDHYDEAYAALARLDPTAADQMSRLHAAEPADPLAAFHAQRLLAGGRGPLLDNAA